MKKRFRILIVDDEKSILRVYKSALESSSRTASGSHFPDVNFELCYCDQAVNAVATVKRALAEKDPFALVFMDLNMPPGEDGDWAAKRIRELDEHIEIVIVTGCTDKNPATFSQAIQPLHKLLYLEKPLHIWEIRQFALALSEKWRNEKELETLKDSLKLKVRDQHKELEKTNSQLSQEIDTRVKAQQSLRTTLKNLRVAFGGIIQVITSMIEARDPYTAGHQSRVADLARSIASEMGCSLKAIEGIRIAAAVHDLGKISIPSDILNKPGSLSNVEMILIKNHVQIGYDLLKEINFPWPVADIIYQHHERLDGTGYPNGLVGDQIMLEARIIMVSDVVEAMKSHRPYRSALGIGDAMDEIRKKSGSYYDPEVVATCCRLFEEGKFSFRV